MLGRAKKVEVKRTNVISLYPCPKCQARRSMVTMDKTDKGIWFHLCTKCGFKWY